MRQFNEEVCPYYEECVYCGSVFCGLSLHYKTLCKKIKEAKVLLEAIATGNVYCKNKSKVQIYNELAQEALDILERDEYEDSTNS